MKKKISYGGIPMLDFIRLACAVPKVRVGDVTQNTEDICAFIEKADRESADLILFPELSLTGYTCADLLFQDNLHAAVKKGLARVVAASAQHPKLTVVVGLPVCLGTRM